MEKSSKSILLFCVLSVILGFVLGLLCDILRHPTEVAEPRVDTITIYKPVAVRETIDRVVYARLPVKEYIPLNPRLEDDHPRDTAKVTADSVEVVIPITQKVYADSGYTAYISGYMADLDSIRIYRHTLREPAPKPSRLNLSVGVGAVFGGRVAPGVFIGVSYTIKEIRL